MFSSASILCGVAALLWLRLFFCRRELAEFQRRWPPISDDEFLRRCPPGTSRETAIKVRRIISEQLGVEYERIYPEQRFMEDLDCC